MTVVKNSAAWHPCSRGQQPDALRPSNGALKSTRAVARLTMTMPAWALRLKCVASRRLVSQYMQSVPLPPRLGEMFYPVVALHMLLLPCHALRFWQIARERRGARKVGTQSYTITVRTR